jgi:histidinol phosphatase-like enzyme (inositol monophosphatase family)
VTEADRQAETAIRELIGARFPDHAIIGEEWDDKLSAGRFAWIIDPIDGTRAFITGVPVWGTLVGLTVDGLAVAGLMAQPFTGEIYMSVPGEASYYRAFDKVPLRTSNVTELSRAKMTTTSPDLFERDGLVEPWARIRGQVLTTRYGLDCYGYALLSAGHIDLVVEAGLKDVDICPLIPLIENAGGVITTWDGGRAENGGNCVAAATPELHAAALAMLRG